MYNVDKIHRAKMNYLKIKYILVRNTCFCPSLFNLYVGFPNIGRPPYMKLTRDFLPNEHAFKSTNQQYLV